MNDPKTVRVRIAVAVQPDGEWNAAGWSERTDDNAAVLPALDDYLAATAQDPMSNSVVRWIEADVPLPPAPQVIEGTVTPAQEQ